MGRLARLAAGLVTVALAGCSDGGTKGAGPGEATPGGGVDEPGAVGATASVETAVSSNAIAAGTVVTVTCSTLDAAGNATDESGFDLDLSSSDGMEIEGLALTPTLAGSFTVACRLGDLADGSPETVSVVPGPVAKTTASVSPESIVAGGSAEVTCSAEDAFGNAVADAAFQVTAAPEGPTATGTTITSTVAGSFVIGCAVKEEGATVETAAWTVTPGAAVTFALALDPEEIAYAIDEGIAVTGTGEDEFGNPVTGLPVAELAAVPEGSHKVFADGQKIRFTSEGFFTISASSAADPSLSATRDVVVDQTPPLLVLTSPDRGFVADGITEVTVEGTVSDNLGTVASLVVNGASVALPPEGGAFSLTMPVDYGLHMIVAEAADPWGNTIQSGRSVLWSDGWYALSPAAFETDAVGDAIVFELSQEAIDDGDHDEPAVDDLAHVVETIASEIDLAAFLPNPLLAFDCLTGDCVVTMKSVTVGDTQVSLTLLDGGMHVHLVLLDFAMEIETLTPGAFGLPGLPIGGTWTAASITLDMDVLLDLVGGEMVSEVKGAKVKIDDTAILLFDKVLPVLDDIVNAGLDLIEPLVLGILETALPFVLQGVVEDTIGGLAEQLALEQEFELPALAEGTEPNVLVLESEATQLFFTPGYMRISMAGLARAKTSLRPHEVPGSVRFTSCGPAGTIPVPPSAPLVGGIHDDLVNQLLFGVWDGGTLSLDLTGDALASLDLSKYGVVLSHIHVDPLLPIVLDSCGGKGNTMEIGDLYLDATLDLFGEPSHIVLWLQATAPVELTTGVDDEGKTTLAFEILGFDPVVVDVVQNEGVFEGDDAGLVELVGGQMLPLLVEKLAGDQLSFALPEIDLHSLADGIPEGTTLNLDLQQIGRSGAYVTVEGGLK